jgi:hypothetical protein
MPFSRLDVPQGSRARASARLDVSSRGKDQRLHRQAAGERRYREAPKQCVVLKGPAKGLTNGKSQPIFLIWPQEVPDAPAVSNRG